MSIDGIRIRTAGGADQRPAFVATELLEAFLGVALVAGIAAAIPGRWGLLEIQPHPLWLVVLAIAIRYGVPAGYVGGASAAGAYCLLLWLRPGEHHQMPSPHELLQPFLLFVGGVITSELVQGQQRRLLRAEQNRQVVAESLEKATERYQALQEVQGELEKRIVGQTASVTTLYEAAKQLSTLDTGALCTATVNLVVSFLEAQACALYLERDGQLQLQAGVPAVQPGRSRVLDREQPLVSQALHGRQVATIRELLLQRGAPAGEGEPIMMAGPLLDGAGRVRGVVVIERLPFLKFSPTSVGIFILVLDWASAALRNADAHTEMREQASINEHTGAFAPAHTLDLLRREYLRSRRYHLPLSVIAVRIRQFSSVSRATESRAATIESLESLLRQHLRVVDLLGQTGDPDTFALILPLTGIDDAQRVAQRIRSDIQAHTPQGAVGLLTACTGVATFSLTLTGPEELLSLALADIPDDTSAPADIRDDAPALIFAAAS